MWLVLAARIEIFEMGLGRRRELAADVCGCGWMRDAVWACFEFMHGDLGATMGRTLAGEECRAGGGFGFRTDIGRNLDLVDVEAFLWRNLGRDRNPQAGSLSGEAHGR